MAVLPLLQRPFDCIVIAFLVSHIPITILIDSQALIPGHYYPKIAQQTFEWYNTSMHDPLVSTYICQPYTEVAVSIQVSLGTCCMQMTHLPPWFKVLVFSEIFVQLPFFFIAAYAFAFGKRWIQKPTIIYGLFVASTMVCILGELALSPQPKHSPALLCTIYLPYLLLPLAMAMKMLFSSDPFPDVVHNKNI